MDEWFKARLNWRKGIETLSDAEAGRFAKALWKYAETGETDGIGGGERIVFAMCLGQLEQDAEKRRNISAERSEAGKKGGRPQSSPKAKKANESKKSNCFSEKANESKKSNCLHKEIRDKNIPPYSPPMGDEGGGGGFATEAELTEIQQQHDAVFAAALRAGFSASAATLDRLASLVAEHGADAVTAALGECVDSCAPNFRYLTAVLKNAGKRQEDASDMFNGYAFL